MASTLEHDALDAPALSPPPSVLLVVSPYYSAVAAHLLAGAEAALAKAEAKIERIDMPGALEIPGAVRLASESGRFDGFVALGCVIRGETSHYDIVAGESARGLMDLTVGRGLAIGNGILTVDTLDQALKRADPAQGDKGGGAAAAALHLIAAARRFRRRAPLGADADILLA